MADETQAVEQEDQEADASGGDSAQGKAAQREERDPPAGESDGGGGDDASGQDEESKKAQEKEEEREQARDKVKELEEGDVPDDLEDWPDDAAKYETFGGPEGEHGYHQGPEEEKLGPSALRHHEDGRVTIAGEEVEDADEYKSEPIPGGPTDPDAPQDLTTQKIRKDQGRELESEDGDDDSESDDSESKSEDEAEAKSGDDS